MSQAKITEVSANKIEVEIDSEWIPLGKSMILQYAESLARAFTLGGDWRAGQYMQSREDSSRLVVKLVKVV